MNILKPILSIVLLLTYLVSFGHRLIPHHHHHEDDLFGCSHVVENLEGCSAQTHHKDQEHYTHENHLDEGLLDYLSCLLSNLDHPNFNEFETPTQIDLTEKQLVTLHAPLVLKSTYFPELAPQIEEELSFDYAPQQHTLGVYLSAFSLRGPPTL